MIVRGEERLDHWLYERLYCNQNFRVFMWETARSFTRDEELLKDLIQEAWCDLSRTDGDQSIEAYRKIVVKAMDRVRKSDARFRKTQRAVVQAIRRRLETGAGAYPQPSAQAQRKIRYRLKRGKG